MTKRKDNPMRDANERRAFAERQDQLKSVRDLVVQLIQQGAIAEKCDVEVRDHDAPDHICLDFEDGTSWLLSVERAA